MLELLKLPHLPPRDANVPHTSPRQNLDGIPVWLELVASTVDRTHATRAEHVHEDERSEHQPLALPGQEAVRLEAREHLLLHQGSSQFLRLSVGLMGEKVADDLFQLTAL